MNNWFAKKIYQGIQFLRKEPVARHFENLKKSQWMAKKDLDQLQFKKLKGILIHANDNIPFYQKRFKEINFNPNNFSNLRELLNIPLLTKDDVRENFEEMFQTNYEGKSSIEFTSGSTGHPMKFYVDREFSAGFRGEMYREHQWAGLELGDKEIRFYGHPVDTKGKIKEKIKDFLMNRVRFSVFNLDDKTLSNYWDLYNKFKPTYIYGYTTAIYQFTLFLSKTNKQIDHPIKAIITTSEVLHPEERELLEKFWKIKVFNEYGCSECGIIASECEAGSLHLNCENNYVEFLDENKLADPNHQAKIVITNLNNKIMPFIRYDVGDIGAYSEKKCECGRNLPLMNIVEGRSNSMVKTPDNKIVSGWIFYYIFRNLVNENLSTPRFRAYQKELNHIHIDLLRDFSIPNYTIKKITEKCHEYLGPTMNITFDYVNEIPNLASGKLVHFISEIE